MKWILIERRPDAIYAAGQEIYLGTNDAQIRDRARATVFATRDAAEAHRRKLKHPYNWVTVSIAD